MADTNHASFHVPPGQFCGLWRLSEYSDVCIRLLSVQTQHQSSNGHESASEIKVYREIPAHKVVLKAGSTYFQGRFTTGQAIAAQPTQSKGQRKTKRVKTEDVTQVIDLACDSEEDAIANEAVLEFLYNHKLPASATVGILCKMITSADYLGADLCVKACAIALCDLPLDQHSVLDVCKLGIKVQSCPPLVITKLLDVVLAELDRIRKCPDLDPAVAAKYKEYLSIYLLHKYGDVIRIMNTDFLLASFCKLPLSSIELWGSSDQLKVDSEDTVVVLLNIWWKSQTHTQHTEECKGKLSGLVRLLFLSSGYVQHALDSLDWYVPPFPDYKYACSVISRVGFKNVEKGRSYNKLIGTERCTTLQTQLTLEWRVQFNQIQQAIASTKDWNIIGPQGYWQGHMWSFELRAPEYNVDVGLWMGIRICKRPANTMPEVPATAKITVLQKPFFNMASRCIMFPNGANWIVNQCVAQQDVAAALKQCLTDDGHLIFKFNVSNVH